MPRVKQEITCQICKKKFKPKRSHIRFCSVACSNLYKSTLTYHCKCSVCGVEYSGKSPSSNWCDKCRLGKCLTCSKEFVKDKKATKFCSRQCASQSKERNLKISINTGLTKRKQVELGTFKVPERPVKKVVCVICNKDFWSDAIRAKYCDDCKKRNCKVCGKEFEVDLPSSKQYTCSLKCRGISQRTEKVKVCSQCGNKFRYKEKKNKLCGICKARRAKKNKVKCLVCGKIEFVPNHQAKHYKCCSKKCLAEYRSISQTKPPEDVTCVVCGKVFSVHPAYLVNVKKVCSDECLAQFRSDMNKGENNPLYGVGHTEEAKRKMSVSHSIRIANGESHFNKGEYISKVSGQTEKFDSSWELERFRQLDEEGLFWTKRHGIRISYRWNGSVKHYVPDILIYTEPRIIEEIKPKNLVDEHEKTQAKIKVGRRWASKNGYEYKVITEFELFDRDKS